MVLAGVADIVTDYRIRLAVERGYALYGATPEAEKAMMEAGCPVMGGLEDLLGASDLVVDCTPKRVAAKNRDRYAAKKVKSIFQGGEKHELTGYSFVAAANYAGAIGRETLRVVSCNTTGLCRIAQGFYARGLIKMFRAVLIRRATDPWESHREGMINTVEPEPHVPSHQGPDAQTVIPDLPVVTMAAKGPFDLSHVHFAMTELTRGLRPRLGGRRRPQLSDRDRAGSAAVPWRPLGSGRLGRQSERPGERGFSDLPSAQRSHRHPGDHRRHPRHDRPREGRRQVYRQDRRRSRDPQGSPGQARAPAIRGQQTISMMTEVDA